MKNKAGMWSILAIGGAVGLAIATGFAYYIRKYDDQFARIKAMDPKMRVRESRIKVSDNSLINLRIYESEKPVWYYCDEAIRANPKTKLVTSLIRKDAEKGRDSWFFTQFPNTKPPGRIYAEISGGKFVPGLYLDKYLLGSYSTYINRSDISKSTLIVMVYEPLDPIEKILAACGFYR